MVGEGLFSIGKYLFFEIIFPSENSIVCYIPRGLPALQEKRNKLVYIPTSYQFSKQSIIK